MFPPLTTSRMNSEVEFANKFQDLIELVGPNSDNLFECVKLNSIKQLVNFSIEKHENPFIPTNGKNNNEDPNENNKTIEVQFKSLRNPKFNIKLNIKSNTLIYKVKSILKENLNSTEVKDESQIKLLLKTKTIYDGENISDLLTDGSCQINFNVMISKYIDADTSNSNGNEDENESEIKFTGLGESKWADIEKIVRGEVKDKATADSLLKDWKDTEKKYIK